MDYRAKNFKEKHINYQSLAELPKPYSLAHHTDHNYPPKINQDTTF